MNTSNPQEVAALAPVTCSLPFSLWRDLEHGEAMQAGDRMMSRDMVWHVWGADAIDARRPVVIGEHTFPAQRLVAIEETDAVKSLRGQLACAKAFHDVAVAQRNLAWKRAEGGVEPS